MCLSMCVCVCVYSQKLQLLTATSIRTPIPYGSFVTEKLGLKMEFPKVEFTEENSIRSRSEPVVSEWEHKQLVRTQHYLYNTIQYNTIQTVFLMRRPYTDSRPRAHYTVSSDYSSLMELRARQWIKMFSVCAWTMAWNITVQVLLVVCSGLGEQQLRKLCPTYTPVS